LDGSRVLGYVSGLLHFYGVMDFETLYQAVEKELPGVVGRDELRRLLDAAAQDEDNPYAFEEWQGCYCDYGVEDPAWVLAEQQRRPMLPYRPVSEEDARNVLSDNYSAVWNEGESRFFAWLTDTSGCDEEVALGLILEYEDNLRNDVAPMDMIMTVAQTLNVSPDAVEEVGRVFIDFSGHVPLWVLKGWSPSQVQERFRSN
jgi:hypothetical protein